MAVIGIALSVLLFSANGQASSFTFRSINPGEPLPTVVLTAQDSGQSLTLDQTSSKNSMVIFWAADNKIKKKRVIKTLKIIRELQVFLNEKKTSLYIVNAGNDTPGIINEVMAAANLPLPVYLDTDLKAYSRLGIFVMPSVLLVDPQGKVAAGLGYSRDLGKRLKGEIEIMLGEKDRAQFEQDLHPVIAKKSAEEKNASRHLHLGQTMAKRGQLESAIRELKKALELAPDLADAQIQLGCLYIDVDQISLAKEALAKGLAGKPDSLDGQICQARIMASEGDIAAAIDDLLYLRLRNQRDFNLHYVTATLLVQQGKFEEAAKEYDSAYNLLLKKSVAK